MRIRRNLAVLSHERTLQDACRRDEQLVGRIAMERLRQLGGFHHDPRAEVQKRHARFRKGAFDPNHDAPIEFQPSVLHQFRDFPTGDDADAEGAIRRQVSRSSRCLGCSRSGWETHQTQMWVSSRITAARPSPRPQQARTAHGNRGPNFAGFGRRLPPIPRSSISPTLRPAGRERREGPPNGVRPVRRLPRLSSMPARHQYRGSGRRMCYEVSGPRPARGRAHPATSGWHWCNCLGYGTRDSDPD